MHARDNFQCQYCARELTVHEATLDHVVPRSQGRLTSWENIVCCCQDCNRRKGGKTPSQARMELLRKPARTDWLPVLQVRLNGKVPLMWRDFLRSGS